MSQICNLESRQADTSVVVISVEKESHIPVTLNKTNESELIIALTQSDEKAFVRIYQCYWKLLYNTAMQRVQDEDQAKDIVQDVFVRMWEQRESLVIGNLQAWLQTAVRYQIYNLVAKEKVSGQYLKYLTTNETVQAGADEALSYAELIQNFSVAMDHMPEKRREIYQLRFEQDMPTQHIAAKLNITQKTVQNQLTKAVHYLKTALSCALITSLLFIGTPL